MKVTIDGVEYSPAIVAAGVQRPLADVLQHACGASGQTLQEVADAVGVTKGHLCNIEHGGSEPGFALAMRLLRYYHITMDRVEG